MTDTSLTASFNTPVIGVERDVKSALVLTCAHDRITKGDIRSRLCGQLFPGDQLGFFEPIRHPRCRGDPIHFL